MAKRVTRRNARALFNNLKGKMEGRSGNDRSKHGTAVEYRLRLDSAVSYRFERNPIRVGVFRCSSTTLCSSHRETQWANTLRLVSGLSTCKYDRRKGNATYAARQPTRVSRSSKIVHRIRRTNRFSGKRETRNADSVERVMTRDRATDVDRPIDGNL